MLTRVLLTFAGLAGAGCGVMTELRPPSVQMLGPDTYQVMSAVDVRDFGGGIQSAQRKALAAAEETCKSQGKQILVNNMVGDQVGFQGMYQATFRCLSPGDPELKRPDFRPTPNVVVEHKR